MKNVTKLAAVVLSATMMVSMTACNFKRDEQEERDPNKTYLDVGNFNGGVGHAWLDEVAAAYMAEHPDVVVKVHNEKDKYGDTMLLENMGDYGNDMYFVAGITLENFIARDKVANITDVVTANLPNESESIESKMDESLRDYYKRDDGQYYAVPFFDAIFGTIYDVDLFEQEKLYFNTNGKLICDDPTNTTLSKGPNGLEGDFDDGLPATVTHWKTLLEGITSFGVKPYMWSGQHKYNRQRWLASLWADYEGKANFDLNATLSGTYTFAGDSEPTPITNENGYLLQKQLGKKFALEMGEYIVDNNMYKSTSFDGTNSNTMAQNDYLLSVEATKISSENPRVAMLFDAGWWENEAKAFFDEMVSTYDNENYGFGKRKFGFMPAPKADDGSSNAGTTLMSSTSNSAIFICKDTDVMDVAKDFLKFCHTDESLRTFTRVSGIVRPYDYTIEDSDRAQMSHFAENVWDIYRSPNTEICHVTVFENKAFTEQASFFNDGFVNESWWWKSKVGGIETTDALYEFWQNKSLTAEQYYNGLQTTFSKSAWDSVMSKYYD